MLRICTRGNKGFWMNLNLVLDNLAFPGCYSNASWRSWCLNIRSLLNCGSANTCCQCPITNASQRAHSTQPHTDVEIMKFLVLPFLDEILSNLFVYVNILAITIQQVCSNKTLLVWSIWPNLSQTLRKTPCYGPGSQLWRANGRGLYLALTTKFPTWCVEGSVWGQLNEGSLWSATGVVYHKG